MAEPQFQIHKLYIKDASFSVPDANTAFLSEWKPELKVEIDTETRTLTEPNTHEVVLKVNCKVKSGKVDAFEAEAHQAGIFEISNTPEDQLAQTLGAYCPNILYPYLRETISDLITRGGFPQLSLAPINFDMLYLQKQHNTNEKSGSVETTIKSAGKKETKKTAKKAVKN